MEIGKKSITKLCKRKLIRHLKHVTVAEREQAK
jgi:hypothetical protein